MSVATSTHFTCASASGENWRDICKIVLEQLESVRTDGFRPNIGFLYMTDDLAADASSILTLVRSVTGVRHWSGCAALGICGVGVEYIDKSAISIMIGQIESEDFREFHVATPRFKNLQQSLEPWLNKHDPMLVYLHADPAQESHPMQTIEEVEALTGGFMVGGFASSRTQTALVSGDIMNAGASGFVFSQAATVATALSQGCIPMGPLREISAMGEHVVSYLEGRSAFEVFSDDMKAMSEKRLGYSADDVLLHGEGAVPQNLLQLLNGETHVAFPVAGTDVGDFMVRNIMAIDPEQGIIAVGETIENGQKMMFVYRDDETVRTDLAATLVALRARVLHEHGRFSPKAALYVSCVARTATDFEKNGQSGGEMKMIREILGDIPIAGFYANGEISGGRLYSYTGILTLFL
ncbi:MAG: hypothetical protein DI551_00245 [Micavibrio aeruginosavorus]|uniref:Histidine kinase n=1 Tax=Micavibrio aeruginosavorus TaxID=349221 RepID=A0A2W5NEC8_9BACT|nr:MAG: hypothetical protein DI551_00245 [Micavibrio aeruginosavorus]